MLLRCLPSSFSSIWHGLGEDVIWRFTRWPTWRPSWISEWNDFNNSKPPCGPYAIHPVWAQGFGADVVSRFSRWHLVQTNVMILAILNLYVAMMLPIKLQLNPTYGSEGDVVWRISKWLPRRPSWIMERSNFSNSESLCCSNASHQVSAQSKLQFGRRCRFKNFKMAVLDIGMEWF